MKGGRYMVGVAIMLFGLLLISAISTYIGWHNDARDKNNNNKNKRK